MIFRDYIQTAIHWINNRDTRSPGKAKLTMTRTLQWTQTKQKEVIQLKTSDTKELPTTRELAWVYQIKTEREKQVQFWDNWWSPSTSGSFEKKNENYVR